MPAYLQGQITRVQAEALVKPWEDGKFCIRKHVEEDQHVLCVVYKGKPTHHLMTVNDDGHITINKKVYKETDDIETLVAYLGSKRAGWPVPLDKPCPSGGGGGGGGGGGAGTKGTPWLHGEEVTREKSESLLKAGGSVSASDDGRFLIRTREEEGQYVLALVFRGKPTQHLIAPNGDGNLTVNKKVYGSPTSDIETLVKNLSVKPPGWPVKLKEFIDTSEALVPWGSSGASSSSASAPASPRKTLAAKAPAGTPWLHGEITREKSESLLDAGGSVSASDDGRFLIRAREGEKGQYVLALVFKGKASQHLIAPNAGGKLLVNKKGYGSPQTDIGALVAELAKKPAGWPVKFKEYIDTSGAVVEWGAAPSPASPSSGGGSPGKKKSVKKKGSVKGSVRASKPWLHDKMTNPQAVALFKGSTTDGTFLVRKHAVDTYAISVIYKGKPTHHLLKAPKGETSTVGGKGTGIKGLIKTVEHLREKRPGVWPIPLGDHIANPNQKKVSVRRKSGSVKKVGSATPAPAPAAAVAPASGDDWLFGTMEKTEVETLIKGNAGGADGSFMVRERGDEFPGQYVLSVMYKGKPTHHLMAKKNGSYIAGKLAFGQQDTVQSLVAHLTSKVPKWPVPLTNPVSGGLASRGITATLPPVDAPIAEDDAEVGAPSATPTAVPAAAASPAYAPPPPPPPPDMPPWVYGIVTRELSEELVQEYAKENGDFLIRTRSHTEEKYTMVLRYKGRPTHHMVELNAEGKFVINRKPFDASTLEELVELLTKPYKGWPTPLLTGIVAPGHIGGADWPIVDPSLPHIQLMEEYDAEKFRVTEEDRLRQLEMDEEYKETVGHTFSKEWLTRSQQSAALAWQQHTQAAEHVKATTLALADITPIETNFDVPSYLWDDCHKKDSIKMLTNGEDGTYLVRRKFESDTTCYLDIKYKGEITTHLLEKVAKEAEVTVLEEPEAPIVDESSTDAVEEAVVAAEKAAAAAAASAAASNANPESVPVPSRATSGQTQVPRTLSDGVPISEKLQAEMRSYPEAVEKLAEIFKSADPDVNNGTVQGGGQQAALLNMMSLPTGMMKKFNLKHRVDKTKIAEALAGTDILEKHVAKFVDPSTKKGRRIAGIDGMMNQVIERCPSEGLTLLQFFDACLNGWHADWSLLTDKKGMTRSMSTTDFESKVEKAKAIAEKHRSNGNPLDEHATHDQIMAKPRELEDALKTSNMYKEAYKGDLARFLDTIDTDDHELVSVRQILTHLMPDADFDHEDGPKLSPRETIMKTLVTAFIHHAQKLKTVDIAEMVARRKKSLRRHFDGTVANMLEAGSSAYGAPDNSLGGIPEGGAKYFGGSGTRGAHNAAAAAALAEGEAEAAGAANAAIAEAEALVAAAEAEAARPPPVYRTITVKGPAVWLLNGENYGNFRLLDNLITRLREPMQGWPVQLARGIANPQRQQRRVKGMAGSGEKSPDAPSYMWPNIGIEDAEKKLVGPDGTFLVRKKLFGKTNEFTLAVKFCGEPTHHKLSKDEYGYYLINDQPVGKENTLDGLVEFLSVEGRWPVVLSNPIRPQGSEAPTPVMPSVERVTTVAQAAKDSRIALARSIDILKAADDRVDVSGTAIKEENYDHSGFTKELRELDLFYAKSKLDTATYALKEANVKLATLKEFLATGGSLPGLYDELTPDAPSYLWEDLSKLETEVKLLGQSEGTFLVRRRKFGTAQQFLLDCVFGGRPTHHSIAANAQGFYIVNNQGTAETLNNSRTLHAVIQKLHDGVRGWPVCLGIPLTNPARAASGIPHELSLAQATVTNCHSDAELAQHAYDILLDPKNALRGPKSKEVEVPSAKIEPAEVVVRAKIQALVQKLGDQVQTDYPKVMGSDLPALPADQLATMMLIAATNLANVRPSGKKLVRRISTGELIPAVEKKASPSKWVDMLSLRYNVGQVRVALDVLEGLDANATAEQVASGLAIDVKACSAAIKKLSAAVDDTQQKYQKLKLDAGDLQTRLLKAKTTPQGEAGAVPPALMAQLVRLEGKSNAKLEAVASQYELQEASIAALGVIASKPHLRQFYLRTVEHLTSVLVQMRAIRVKQQMAVKSLGSMDGIDCAFGFVPIPEGGADCGAAQLFAKGVLDSDESIIWAAEETGRALTFRFQEQAQQLQFPEVGRFARWLSRPVIEMMVSYIKNSRVQLMLAKADAQQKFGIGIFTDLNNTARHVVNKVTPGGLAQQAGVQMEDVVIAINGRSIAQLDHKGVLEMLSKTSSAKLEIGRGKDWAAPKFLKDVPAFFVRTVDAFKAGGKCLDEYDDDLLPTYFNQAMNDGLLGGPLIPSDDGTLVPAADFVQKSGLRADSTEDEFLWFSSDQTDTNAFGYRYQLAASMNVYANTQAEVQGLGWTNFTFFRHADGDSPGDLSGYNNASGGNGNATREVSADTGTLYRRKSMEAASLNKRVRELENQLEVLRNSTAA